MAISTEQMLKILNSHFVLSHRNDFSHEFLWNSYKGYLPLNERANCVHEDNPLLKPFFAEYERLSALCVNPDTRDIPESEQNSWKQTWHAMLLTYHRIYQIFIPIALQVEPSERGHSILNGRSDVYRNEREIYLNLKACNKPGLPTAIDELSIKNRNESLYYPFDLLEHAVSRKIPGALSVYDIYITKGCFDENLVTGQPLITKIITAISQDNNELKSKAVMAKQHIQHIQIYHDYPWIELFDEVKEKLEQRFPLLVASNSPLNEMKKEYYKNTEAFLLKTNDPLPQGWVEHAAYKQLLLAQNNQYTAILHEACTIFNVVAAVLKRKQSIYFAMQALYPDRFPDSANETQKAFDAKLKVFYPTFDEKCRQVIANQMNEHGMPQNEKAGMLLMAKITLQMAPAIAMKEHFSWPSTKAQFKELLGYYDEFLTSGLINPKCSLFAQASALTSPLSSSSSSASKNTY